MALSPREVGRRPSLANVLWSALAGLVASVLVGFPLHSFMGWLTLVAAPLVGSTSLSAGWTVHLVAGLLAGAFYGFFVQARDVGRGFALGGAYGALVGLVAFVTARVIGLLPGAPMGGAALGAMLLHAGWGALMGAAAAWAMLAGMRGGAGRRVGRPAP